MGLGDMVGKAASALGGGDFDFGSQMADLGIEPSMLAGLDLNAAISMIEEKGFDLSMLDSLGLNIEDLLAKFTGSS